MRSKFYDNELTVTCLFNHVKLVAEMNRDMEDVKGLKAKIADAEKKIADMGTLHRKEINEYKKKVLFMDVGGKESSVNKREASIKSNYLDSD